MPKPTANTTARSNSVSASTSGVLEYLLQALPRPALLQLYTEETRGRFVCRAVLQRGLAAYPAAQQIVLRLLCTGGTFPVSGVQVWLSKEKLNPAMIKKKKGGLLAELYRWAVIQDLNTNPNEVTLTPEFMQGFQASLCSLESSPWPPVPLETQREVFEVNNSNTAKKKGDNNTLKVVTLEDLERYTQTQRDVVLHFLVGTTGYAEPAPAVVHFLLQTGLMQPDPDYKGANADDAPLVITEKGYDFMLRDNHQQVWHFVVQYLQSLQAHEKKGPKLVREALLLLICLSFSRVGECYWTSSLSKHGRIMVQDLAHFGLLYTVTLGEDVATTTLFYPTRVAMQLCGGSGSAQELDLTSTAARYSLSSKALSESLSQPNPVDSPHLAIIVQTNFQLCAYTTSTLHVSMLGLFCDVNTIRRLPNVVFMSITRDSVKAAFHLGIQARQILRFLEKHAHPKLRSTEVLQQQGGSTIPGNVIDQIWLWERERSRVKCTEVYQHQCLAKDEFDALIVYAQDRGALAWSSSGRMLLFLAYDHAERIQAFVRQWRAKKASREV